MIIVLDETSKICKDGKKRRWIKVKCSQCDEEIWKEKRFTKNNKNVFCSRKCLSKFYDRRVSKVCAYCGKKVLKKIAHSKGNKTNFFFCNRNCKDKANKELQIFRSTKIINCKRCCVPVEVDSNTNSVICEECKPSKKYKKYDYSRVILGLEEMKSNSFIPLKNFLINKKIKENKCEICGIIDWLEKPITLQLHHVDGNRKNNHIENLKILCPNCHTQTDNWGYKNRMVDVV